ncbi:cytochrome-c peroxidase [Marinospirillum minutulum]|uniref:cytochrome-c peroxidase n=1 Tax=Marinospirillum minutulum TaxID=64974 RepID=UPI0004285DA4|nr:cytochrome c peroxidase [Marinospirillum minutulum]
MFSRHTLVLLGLAFALPATANTLATQKEHLGQQLFFDTALSKNFTQSCASCHQVGQAFVDKRGQGVAAAVSLGDDGHSLGDRNAPTVTYAAAIPPFHLKANGIYAGGLFLDGRAATLAEQAEGPPLNPIEMGMTSAAEVVARLKLNSNYVAAFKQLYGEQVFADSDTAYKAMADAIAAFERTALFNPYDSKYDREQRGEYTFTDEEELGRTLFFSQQFTNCNQCHQLETTPNRSGEVFTNFEYHNIGVPENKALRAMNGVKVLDEGLFQHPDVNDPAQRGKFRTPTLRNVAVTGPYMHNGVFEDLRTVVLFYNKFNSKAAKRQINPETGELWGEPEIAENISMDLLTMGPALDDRRIDALVAFMKTLTDQRYEHLLKAKQ